MDANPFDAIAAQDDLTPEAEKAPAAPKPPATDNIFDTIAAKDDQPETSALGAAAVSAGKGLIPALAGVVPGAAAGAELGGALGAPLGPVSIGIGGFGGGLIGGFIGGAAVQKAQDWALSQLPHGWTDPLTKYEQAAEEQHKTASFVGGLAPFALTSWPVGAAKAGETALERLMADPITSRLFGGALMGGLELGQQKLRGEEADWTDVAISTGFGVMFNKPTALGEKLHKVGARAAQPAAEAFVKAVPAAQRGRAPLAAAEVLARGKNLPRPDETTLADVWSTGIAGPGATEETASGAERMSDEARRAAQDAARAELPEPEPDLHLAARAWAPEVFERADALDQERDHLRAQITDLLNPPDRVVDEAERRRDQLQTQYDAHLEATGGYTGDRTGRQLRAQIREVQREVNALVARRGAWETGQAQDTEAITALRQRLTEITHERMDVGREIAAALRHAEENAGRAPPEPRPEIVEPEPVTGEVTVAPEAAAPVEQPAKPEAPAPKTPPEMRQRIAEDAADRLERAGIEPEKAAAWGKLVAARYATRAAWRSDLTAEELYHKEGLNFRRIAYDEFQRERAQAGRKAKAALKPKDGEIVVNGEKITGEAAAQLAKKIEEAERTAPRATEAIEPLIVNGQEVTGEAAMLLRKAMERAATPAAPAAPPVIEPPKPISADELRGQAIKEPQTLLGFIRGMGGVKDWKGELKAADLHKRYPGLVNNKRGQALDAAREAAEEAGYLPPDSTPDDLVRALLSDEPVYSAQDQDIAQAYRMQEASRDKMRAIKDARAELNAPEFEGHNPEILDEAAWLMVEEGMTPDAALETASIRAILPLAKELDYELADYFEAEIDRAANSARNRAAETARLPAGEEIPQGLGVAFEPGAEGKPQRLIPGIEPVTDRERAELQAGKPLRGGNAAPPAGGLFDEDAINQQELFQSGIAPTFYSAVSRAIDTAKQEKASPDQWLATIKNVPGVKPEEMKWLGLEDWLKEQKGTVTREQIADYVRANNIEVKEIEKGVPTKISQEDRQVIDAALAKLDVRFIPRRLVDNGQIVESRINQGDIAHWAAEKIITPEEETTLRRLEASNDLSRDATKYGKYRLPGGENYRELLLTLPPTEGPFGNKAYDAANELSHALHAKYGNGFRLKATSEELARLDELEKRGEQKSPDYKSSHWEEPNILSHIRFDDRRGPNGERVLHIAEVQSDWHQAGRKQGYREENERKLAELIKQRDALIEEAKARPDDLELGDRLNALHDQIYDMGRGDVGVPDAPFKTSWPELAMKRMIRYAVDHGYDRVSWDTGAVNADRYDLSKQISKVRLNKREDGKYYLTALDHHTNAVIDGKRVTPEELPDYIGKETAEKLLNQEPVVNKRLEHVAASDLVMSEDEHSRTFKIRDSGRSVTVGKGTEKTEDGAREYAARYLNTKADEINHNRRNSGIETRELSGLDLKVGGEGMRGFYDDILPKAVNKLVKKYGAKVETSEIPAGARERDQVRPDEKAIADHDAEWQKLNEEIRQERENLAPTRDLDERDKIQTRIEKLEERREDLHSRMVNETLQRTPNEIKPVHSLEITPELENAAAEGFPLFQDAKKAAIHLPTRMVSLFEHADFSSIAHEGGHDFLRQMQEDIRHPDAPQQLKNDFQTVLNWLNKGRGKPSTAEHIQERHHEKFARAWERYIMEGRAPSKELASVFEKMKQWMLDIYQAVVGNRLHPINAEVRAVFDRLLTEEPHMRIVEAEAPPREPSLSDVHIADAETVEPQDALPAADQIAAERARAEQEAPQEIANEIATAVAEDEAERAATAAVEPGTNAGAGAGGRGEVGEGGEKAGPITTRGEVGAGAGAEREGGNAAAPESRGMVGKEQPKREPPAGSAERLAPRPWDNIIGKPNAIESIDNLIKEIGNGDPGVEQELRTRAEAMDFSQFTNGRVTWDQHEEWARATGMPVHELTDRHFGEAWNSRQMYFAAETINQLNQEIWQARQTGDAVANVVEYERKKALRDALINQFVGARAEAGRALNIFKALKQKFGDTMDETFFQTWREITGKEFSRSKDESEAVSKLTNKDAVAQFLHNTKERTFGRMAFEYWMCSIVSNYVSQLTDTVGAFTTAASKLTIEAPLAAAVGAAKGEAQRVRAGEAVAGWKAVPGALPAATKAAIDTFRTGRLTHLPGQELQSAIDLGYYGVGEPLKEGAALGDVKESAFGLMTGISDAIRAMGAIQPGAPLLKSVHTERGMIPNLEIKGAEMPLGDFLRSPLNFLKSMEAFSASMAFAVEKNMIAYRTAVNEGHKAEALKQRIGELMTTPPPELIEEAVKEARSNALAYRGGKVSGMFAGWLNKMQIAGWPIGRFVVPFVNISSIMMNEALLKRTPLGFLSKEIRADLVGENGKIAQQKAQARMMVGTSIGVMAMSLAASGMMTGSAPTDPKERALWVAAGKQPYSVKVGDNWYSYKRLGVFGLHLGIFADMFLVSQQAIEEKSLSDGIGSAIHAVAKNVIDQSYFKGPSDLLRAVTEKGYGEYYVRNFLSGFVPFSGGMGQTAQLIDPYSRQARSVTDAIMSKIPIVSERLPQRLDIFGRPLPSRDPWGPFAIWSQQQSKDPVLNEMMRLEYYPAQVGKTIRGVDLTDAQHDEFARIAGAVMHDNLARIVASPQWAKMPDGIKKDLMETAVRRSRESVRGWMMSKYRDIPSKAYQLKRERLQ